MKVLIQLNAVKSMLKGIEVSAEDLPDEIKSDFLDAIAYVREKINDAGAMVEKYFQDEKTFETMLKTILMRMDTIPLYDGLDQQVKKTIADKIIRNKDMNLLTEDQFKEFITDKLKTSGMEDLIKKSYSKYDIIKLGEAVESIEASETKKYESGIGVLMGLVSTPSGRDEAIAHGVERIMKDVTAKRYYIAMYYGLTKSKG